MKKLFTPLLLFMTAMFSGINVSAQDEVIDLTADMFYTWTGFDQNAVKGSQYETVDFNIGNDVELSGGGVVCGNGDVSNWLFADLTGCSKLIIEGTVGMPLRVMMNRQEDNSLTEKNPTIGEDGTVEVDLLDLPYVHLNTIKINWGAPTGVISSIKLVKPSDPLAVPKEQLKNETILAKMYNAIAYTEDSYAALQTAIETGEETLKSATTADELQGAVTSITDAIAGLTLAEEYTSLTADLFKSYASVEEPGEGKTTGCAYDFFKAVSTPYGDVNVSEKNWADLAVYDKLVITMGDNKTPRVMMNRMVAGGNDADAKEDSKMLEMVPGSQRWSTTTYAIYDNEANVFTVDLRKIVEDYGFARLNAIKYPWGQDGIITGLYLYTAKDPLELPKENLGKEIDNAELYDAFAKTEVSFAALQSAIEAAKYELTNKNATAESLAAAGNAIAEAIAGLELEEGYEKLTADMFKKYNSYAEPGEGKETNGAYKLFESTDNPYGTGGSDNNRWADLSAYDKLIVTFLGEAKPRVWINRKEDNGQDGSSIEDSNMLDLQDGNGKWSTRDYTSFEKDDEMNINIFTVDLNKIKADYNNVARLHGIKYGWGASGIVTGMYLYTSTDDLELPLEALRNEISKAEKCDKFLKTEQSLNALKTAIDEGKDKLAETKPSVESVNAATAKITEAIAGLTLKPGYSDLTKEMYKKYNSVENPGDGEPASGDFKLSENTGQPFGVSTVDYDKWAELTGYDQLIVKTDGNGGKPRFLMNRLVDGGQQGPTMAASNMLDITFGDDSWSANAYANCEEDAYSIDLTKIIDDYGFARLNTIKSKGGDIFVTGMYLYKDPNAPEEYNLTFNIDDPDHVVVTVNGEEIEDLKAGADNEKKVADRANLVIAPADGFIFDTITADGENVAITNGSLTRTITRAINFTITTKDADPLAQPKKDLTAIIERANLYDGFAKTEDSFEALTTAIAAANTAMTAEDATSESLKTAGDNVNKAINGLTLAEGYSYLAPEMFKKYASVEEPGEGVETECDYELFNTSRKLYGDSGNDKLKWADLTDSDQLIITTVGKGDLPRFCMNDEVAEKFEINPYDGTNEATDAYQTIDGNRYIIDLKKIVKDNKFAHLHSIQVNGWGTGAMLNGMYLYKEPFVAVTEVSLDVEKIEDLMEGETVKLTATVLPDNATEPAVIWSSSDEKIATVDQEGTVTAVAPGSVTITATAGEVSAKCEITVTAKPILVEGIVLNESEVVIVEGAEFELGYTINPENATDKTVIWSSSNETVAAVDANGKVKTIAAGEAVITAKAGEKSAECKFIVKKAVASVTINRAEATMMVGETLELNATIDPADAIVTTVTWSSSDEKIATVDQEGTVTAVAAGSVTITAAAGEVSATCRITVEPAVIEVAEVTLDKTAAEMLEGETLTLVATVTPDDATDATVTWSSSDEMVATVDQTGKVTAVGAGNAVITAMAGDKTAECNVSVDKVTGIALVGFDPELPIKVFDLRGLYVSDKIDGLRTGYYIIYQGNNVKKVYIR